MTDLTAIKDYLEEMKARGDGQASNLLDTIVEEFTFKERIPTINLNDSHRLGIYSTGSYTSVKDAADAGAIYETRSAVTGYGMTSLYDIKELIEAASICVANEDDHLVVCIHLEGKWYDLTHDMIEAGSD